MIAIENVALLISSGDYGKAIADIFEFLSSNDHNYVAEIDSYLSFALTQFADRLIKCGHIAKADWLWNRAMSLTSHNYFELVHSFSRYLRKIFNCYMHIA